MRPLVIGLLVLSLSGTGLIACAAAQNPSNRAAPAGADTLESTVTEGNGGRSWLSRTFHRFFGSRGQIGEEL